MNDGGGEGAGCSTCVGIAVAWFERGDVPARDPFCAACGRRIPAEAIHPDVRRRLAASSRISPQALEVGMPRNMGPVPAPPGFEPLDVALDRELQEARRLVQRAGEQKRFLERIGERAFRRLPADTAAPRMEAWCAGEIESAIATYELALSLEQFFEAALEEARARRNGSGKQ